MEELSHHGILGMKWGVRRAVGSDGRINPKKERSEDFIRSRALRRKSVSEMTNAELKTLTERMNLEQQYKNLNKQKANIGQKIVTDVLKEVGKEAVKTFIKGKVGLGGK